MTSTRGTRAGGSSRVALACFLALGACGEVSPPRAAPDVPVMPTPSVGQAMLSGHVRASDGQPIAGASVLVAETDARAVTDEAGGYQLMVPADSTVTLMASATGRAATFRESVLVAAQATIADFDLRLLTPDELTAFGALAPGAGPAQDSTRGLLAVRLHSLDPACVLAGAELSVWPPQAGTVLYSRPASAGSVALDPPDGAMANVQAGAIVQVWLAAALPPGNGLTLGVAQAGCRLLNPSPSMAGLMFPGQRHVAAQALTEADLFLGARP